MGIQELISRINQCMDNLDLVSARRYMEKNMEILNENKHRLRRNARELFDFLLNKIDQETNPLNRKELNVIYTMNTYASRFDVRSLKRTVENNTDLLMREDVKHYLNGDAKILLEGMCAIQVS